MNRKVLGALVGVAVVAVAIWFLAARGGGEPGPKVAAPGGKPGKLAIAAPESQSAAARALAPTSSFDLDPEGPLRLEGQVQDVDGTPVAGAEVQISTTPPRTATTEDDGSFFFDKLVGRTYYLSATHAANVGGPVTYKLLANNPDPVVIRLVEGAKLEVTVLDVDKKPVADADVKNDHDHVTRTGADGKALIKPVRSGWAGVEVSASGYAPTSSFTSIGSPGSTGHLTVTLKKGVAVSGRVLDDQTGAPIAAAHVIPTTEGSMWGIGEASEPVITNDKGEFSVIVAAGSHRLKVSDGEHAPTQSAPVTVRDAAITGVEVRMKGGGAVVGRVDDREGKPVAFATVRLGGARANMWERGQRTATTDRAGVFELHGLVRGKFSARAESDTAASKIVDVDLTTDATRRDVVLVLEVSGTISGTVVDETGVPVPEVSVNAMPDVFGGAKADSIALSGMSNATTDGSGNFRIHGLPDGAYRVWASRTGGNNFRGGFDDKGVTASTGDKGVKIVMSAPGIVTGKLSLDGKPPTSATVQIGPGQLPTQVENGTFTVKDVPAGTLDAIFHGPEFAELIKHDIKVEPGKTTDLGTIDVSRGRVVTGKVVDAAGTGVAGARVRLGQMLFSMQGLDDDTMGDMRGMRSTTTDQDGSFTMSGVGKKAAYVAAEQAERGQSTALQLPEGTDDPPTITLQLRGWGSITGTVTFKGQPVPSASVTETTKNGGAQMAMTQTDVDGNFSMLKVAEGTHVLSVMQQKGFGMSMKSTSATAQVTAGQPTRVAIEIPAGTITLSIKVAPLPNAAFSMAQVFLINGLTNATSAKQLEEGMFGGGMVGMKPWFAGTVDFEELMPGDYTACSVPITGSVMDPHFQQWLQEHMQDLKVVCNSVKVTPSPTTQTFSQALPSMSPTPP